MLEYHVAVGLTESESLIDFTGRLLDNGLNSGSNRWDFIWQPIYPSNLVVQLSLFDNKMIAPAHLGILSIPQNWQISKRLDALEAALVGPEGEVKKLVPIEMP